MTAVRIAGGIPGGKIDGEGTSEEGASH
jgi:hypothetical protein